MAPPGTNIWNGPPEILREVLQYSEPRDLLRATQVNTFARNVVLRYLVSLRDWCWMHQIIDTYLAWVEYEERHELVRIQSIYLKYTPS